VAEADGRDTVVLLAGPGDTTDIVANYLRGRVAHLEVIVEESPSRTRLARRRAARIGWPTVIGQILFITTVLPYLRWRGRARIEAIIASAGLDATPYPTVRRVTSVNDPATEQMLRSVDPTLVVVNGTRIITATVLDSVDRPFINTHAGITPRYRGVHGGYWALVEGDPDRVGTTVHLVDTGIDTGGVLAQATFSVTPEDSIATYPYLHLAAGLPILGDQVDRALRGEPLSPLVEDESQPESHLYLHPTLWAYLRHRIKDGVR
jgi:hypothetical protein